jgi:hypothetical protein
MRPADYDVTFRQLRHLAVLAPDPARSERVRARCRAAIGQRRQNERPAAHRRSSAVVFKSGLTLGLAWSYLSAMICDVLRVYLRW